jgi:S1-C subfamily serine protease
VLKEGDFILRVNGATVSAFRDVERAAAAAIAAAGDDAGGGDVSVSVTVWRGGAETALRVGLAAACALGTRRLLHWAGAQLQATHRSVRELGFAPPADGTSATDAASAPPPSGVFVSRWHHGSPAQRWGLYALHWITAVNGTPTPDLDAFADAVRGLGEDADVRLSTVALNTRPKVLTLKTDDHYWPPFWLECDAAGDWRRREL